MNIYGKNLIISADDFGISPLANAKILELVRLGKVDRVAVMMSNNLDQQDVEDLRKYPVKIDIHLHLISPHSDYWYGNRRLKEGAIKRMILFVVRYILRKTSPEKVGLRWAIQIEKFRDLFGKNPDGIGSHEYIHFFPPYMKEVLKLGEEYQIPFVRMGKYNFIKKNFISKILNWQRKMNLVMFKKSKLNTSDYLVSFDWFGNNVEYYMKKLPENKITEVVCHPEREEEFEMMKKF